MDFVLSTLDYIIIAVFIVVIVGIGVGFSKQAGKDISNFFVGGRNLPWYIAGTSMVATTFAADTPLAVTELVAQGGIAGNWLWWNMLAGGMLTTFFFARYWRRAQVITDVELIGLRYSGKAARFLRGFRAIYLGLFMNALIIGWVNVALMALLEVFFGIPESQLLWWVALSMGVVVIYSGMSGLLGVAFTDVIQFIVAMVGTIALAYIVLDADAVGGIAGLKEKLPSWALDFFPKVGAPQESTDFAGTLTLSLGSFLAYTTVQWWASWYPGSEPGGGGYVVQRMSSARSEKDSIYATLFFQVAHYCLRPWPWIIVALCALVLYPELSPEDKKLGYVMAMKDFLPDGLKGLLLVAFFSAYMSTISTQLNWATSYLINDVYKEFINPEAGNKDLVRASRLGTLLLMLVALFATSQITSIAGVWRFIIECGAGLGLVLILRWYWWRINAWSEISATVAPFIAYGFARYYFGWEFPDSFFFTVTFTTIVWLATTFLTRPTDSAKLQSFYDLIKPDGNWKPFRDPSQPHKSNLGKLAICWISAIALAYSALFMTGSIIFGFWTEAAVYGAVLIVSLIVLRTVSQQVKIFAD
jgi:Na+/proline symporter